MQYWPDIVVSDRFGVPSAIVVVKALSDSSPQTATRYLRNLLAHGVVPHARFVLLITPDIGYLWDTPAKILREAAPSFTFAMARITQHYLPSNGRSEPVRGLVLESIVSQWLSDLADGIAVDDEVVDTLHKAGFLEAVRDGLVSAQARV